MKNTTITTLLLALLIGFGTIYSGAAQERKIQKADKKYESFGYVDAERIYLKVAEKGYESEELFTRLANSYYYRAKYDEAVKWYKKLFELNEAPSESVIYLRYSQSLRATGDDANAAKFYDRFLEKSGDRQELDSAKKYEKLIEINSGRYEMAALGALYDTEQITYGHTVKDNKLVYSTTEEKLPTFLNTRDAWDGLSFVSLYEIEINGENQAIGAPEKIKGKLHKRFHDASPVYTNDGKTVYFTRTNYDRKGNDPKGYNLKIYRSDQDEDGVWKEPKELSISSDDYSTAHPALTPDGKKMYFTSDQEGGYGQSDIYVVDIDEDGNLGEPQNLGKEINTKGRENFPFVSKDSVLYFSSDGHYGMGGLDVFAVRIQEDGTYGRLLNVGAPVNSYADDFAFGIDSNSKYGFVSSDRGPGGNGLVGTNIYSFLETEGFRDKAKIFGYVTDKQTKKPIEGATVTARNSDMVVEATTATDGEGYYEIETFIAETYTVRAEKKDYDTDEKVSKPNLEEQQIDLELQNMLLVPGADLSHVLNIPMIYFDFDKWNIREDAQVDLQKLYEVLQEYPDMRINIRSHTDSRGSDAYNQKLSERRAKSTRDYLIGEGIDEGRMDYEGVGERELVNECKNGVPCSAEKHQQNRRSQFIIADFK